MVIERYSDRMLDKLNNALNTVYARQMYKKIGELENVVGYETMEHYRSIPEAQYKPIKRGDRWGVEYGNVWLKGSYKVPREHKGKRLYAIPNTGAYETLFFIDGAPRGIFNSKGDYMGIMHSAQIITENSKAYETLDLAFECYAGHYCAGCGPYDDYHEKSGGTDMHNKKIANPGYDHTYESIDICELDEIVHGFVFDLIIVMQLARRLRGENSLRSAARNALEQVFANIIQYPKWSSDEAIHSSLQKCRELMAPVLEKKGSEDTRGSVYMIGHSHLDTAWLWPVSETIRKAARTYSNVIRMMELYPNYTFLQSSALHLDWMKRYYPSIFESIKKYVAEGRYEPNGGVWVECDCNITSGELMARQFLFGQLYTRAELGYTSDSFWLPDTFGYNAAIPQIMRESEVKYFFTTKMGWNDLNGFPFTTFNWRGIDGSEVLTHLHSIDILPDVNDISGAIEGISNKTTFDGRILPFGHGDGGGGPTPATIEKANRIVGLPGVPRAEYSTISKFMQKVEREAVNVPTYAGELYLELHRGTLTQMHDMKRTNRKGEFALRDTEYFNVIAGDRSDKGTIDDLYRVLLQNQFHDILPGTCYTGVTQLAVSQNKEMIASANAMTNTYAGKLVKPNKEATTVFNTTSFDRSDSVYITDNGLVPVEYPSQKITTVTGERKIAVSGVTVPALGGVTLKMGGKYAPTAKKGGKKPSDTIENPFHYNGDTLTTPFAKVTFDENGHISSFYDTTAGRELRRKGGAPLGAFWVAEDVPNYWDDWDIDYDIYLKLKPESTLIERKKISGPIEYRIKSSWKIGRETTLTQVAVFHADTPRVDFETLIDWKDQHTLLKVGFDLDIATTVSKHEIQFGHIDRATTSNNNYEAAKFEVCQHKWTDLSEGRYGVALLNDCKYGISVDNSEMRLTLHRGGCRPDVTGDAGLHEVTYSLLPHNGAFSVPSVVAPAYLLNIPAVEAPGELKRYAGNPYIKVSADNIIVEAVKPAELVDGGTVIRLYEAERTKTTAEITLPSNATSAYLTNILEDIKEELPIVAGKVKVEFGAFQIRTLLIK